LIVGAESVSEADEVPEGDPHEFFGEFFEFPPSKFEILKLSDDAGSEQGFRIGSSVSITSTSTWKKTVLKFLNLKFGHGMFN